RVHFGERGLHELRDRIDFEIAAHGHVNEWKIFLRPWQIKFHARRFRHSNRAHVSDDSDDLTRHAEACHQECFADWIFIWENLLRPGLTNQTDLLSVSRIVLIELAASQKRNTPGFEIFGRDVVAWRAGAFLHGRNIAVRARVKRSITSIQGNIAADCRALETANIVQLIKYLFCKTLTRRSIGILRDRECNCARPKTLGTEADVLLTQTDETRDEQRCAGQQRDRERDLRAYENFAETLLAHTAARAAAALFQAAHQIGVGSLERRINSHQEPGQDRQCDRENQYRNRQARRVVLFQRKEVV